MQQTQGPTCVRRQVVDAQHKGHRVTVAWQLCVVKVALVDISKHTDFQEESLKTQDVISPQRLVSGGMCSLEQKLWSGWSYQ